jgi:hypothetical protein
MSPTIESFLPGVNLVATTMLGLGVVSISGVLRGNNDCAGLGPCIYAPSTPKPPTDGWSIVTDIGLILVAVYAFLLQTSFVKDFLNKRSYKSRTQKYLLLLPLILVAIVSLTHAILELTKTKTKTKTSNLVNDTYPYSGGGLGDTFEVGPHNETPLFGGFLGFALLMVLIASCLGGNSMGCLGAAVIASDR